MTEKQNPIVAILVKHALKQPLNEEEQRLLEEWQARSDAHAELPDLLGNPEWRDDHQREVDEAPSAAIWENIRRHIRENQEDDVAPIPIRARVFGKWIWAAAVVAGLIVLAGRAWWFAHGLSGDGVVQKAAFVAAVAGDDVSIVLRNGQVIHPQQARRGEVLAEDGGMKILRTSNGVEYAPVKIGEYSESITHSIIVGRKATGAFLVAFPDGSRVWLDTNTRFAYPVALRSGPDPVVEGQAFFSIAHHDPGHPLRIWTGKGESVSVLGTSFTVRSYAGEAQGRVELYTGKVRVQRKRDSLVLDAGRLALMTAERGLELQKMGPHDEMPGWARPAAKSPYFEFQNTPLADVLREVGDWYGKGISNPNDVKGVPVTGKLPHSDSLEHTLQALQQVQGWHTLLRCKADTIFVSPGVPGP